jgi:hypothetical protein
MRHSLEISMRKLLDISDICDMESGWWLGAPPEKSGKSLLINWDHPRC